MDKAIEDFVAYKHEISQMKFNRINSQPFMIASKYQKIKTRP